MFDRQGAKNKLAQFFWDTVYTQKWLLLTWSLAALRAAATLSAISASLSCSSYFVVVVVTSDSSLTSMRGAPIDLDDVSSTAGEAAGRASETGSGTPLTVGGGGSVDWVDGGGASTLSAVDDGAAPSAAGDGLVATSASAILRNSLHFRYMTEVVPASKIESIILIQYTKPLSVFFGIISTHDLLTRSAAVWCLILVLMCAYRATVSAVSCLVVPAFICINLLIWTHHVVVSHHPIGT